MSLETAKNSKITQKYKDSTPF